MSSGYLDDEGHVSGSSLLFAHLQEQSYHRRISYSGRERSRHTDDVKDDQDIDDDEEVSITTWDSEEEERRAQQEWEESIRTLNLAIQVMVIPFVGKWLGRKWSYWAFSRYQQHGFSASFFAFPWTWMPTSIVPDSAVAALQP